jgi:hypothetical protein
MHHHDASSTIQHVQYHLDGPVDGRLSPRFDWTNLTPVLDLTKKILQHQSDCSLPTSTFTYRNRFGLGSDLHVYAQAMSNALESQRRIRTVGNWTWMDQTHCQNAALGSPMKCYFAQSELNCPGDVRWAVSHPDFDLDHSLSKPNGSPSRLGVHKESANEEMIQLATIESLFTRVTPLVFEEAERQLNLVFGDLGTGAAVPKDLITVHIRWGDKVENFYGKHKRYPEMKKVSIEEYINAIRQILERRRQRQLQQPSDMSLNTANIYLATEDPSAVNEFRAAMPQEWNLYVDRFLTETQIHRVNEYNGAAKLAKEFKGRTGLLALGSLLVAMEANDFVLTTESNWSRIMDELRRSIVDSRCGNCTIMIDLRRKK